MGEVTQERQTDNGQRLLEMLTRAAQLGQGPCREERELREQAEEQTLATKEAGMFYPAQGLTL